MIIDDVRNVAASDLLGASTHRKLDLVVGCAPCQGFCSLTRKVKREDPRNKLPLEMARLIREIRPTAVMMENVPGLETRGRSILEEFVRHLEEAGYYCNYKIVQMADYGVPQYRRRLVLLAGLGFPIGFPKPTHDRAPCADSGKLPWLTLREAIGHLRAPVTLTKARKNGGPDAGFNWHVVSDLQARTKARLRAAVPGRTWREVDESIRPPCHRNGYKGFTNTYGRMSWDSESVTITGGCTTPCKGRFGHPDRRRYTISVREAALIQTFPEDYRFKSDQIEAVCQMIGNAVPPQFAEVVGREAGARRHAGNDVRESLAIRTHVARSQRGQ